MGLTLDQLVFDPTGPSEGANVGAFLRDSAGNLITSTLVSTHQALDVNVVSPITTSPEPDNAPATQAITAQDTSSSTTTQANGQTAITGTPTAGSAASFALSSQESVEVQVTGTWTGTLVTEFSIDGGTTWFGRGVKQADVSYISSSFTANFAGGMNVTGATNFRVRSTATWTGTATVKIISSINAASITVTNPLTLRDATTQSIMNTIKAASTAAVATDTALVVALSPNSPIPTGSNTIGAVTQGTTPWVDNLTQVGGAAITLGQKVSASSLPVVIASDQSAIPVSQSGAWTVSATQGTTPWVDNITQFGGNAVVTGTGASGLGIPRVTVSNDSNILATQSGTWTVQQGTPPWSVVGNVADGTADSGDPVKTGTRASFGAALSAQAATNDRSDMISDRYRRLFVSGSADVAVKNTAVTVTASAAALLSSQLQGRRKVYIQNNSTKNSVYLGSSSAVTTSTGLKIAAGAVWEDEVGEDVSIFVIGDGASIDVRVFELA
jgi:hypothetical protein